MANKDQLHHWSRTVITILSLAFLCGISYRDVGSNKKDIDKHDDRITGVEDEVHVLQLNERDMQGVYTRIDSSLKRIEAKQMVDSESGRKTAEAVIKIQTQMDNFERVD